MSANISVGASHYGSRSLLITNKLSAVMRSPSNIGMQPIPGEFHDIDDILLLSHWKNMELLNREDAKHTFPAGVPEG